MKVVSMPRATLLTGMLLLILAIPGTATADEPDRAALAIVFGEERLETLCISFDGDEVSGAGLLALAGLDVVVDTSSGMGASVCRISGLGCVPPGEDCFCQCMGGNPCRYWNYYYLDPGQAEWVYSPFGASLRKVKPGAVEGWVWGDGHTPPDPEVTFEEICMPATPQATLSVEPLPPTRPATNVGASETPAGAMPPTATPRAETGLPTSNPAPTAPPTATPAPGGDSEVDLAGYWPFGAVVLGLVGIAALVRWRRA